MFEQQEDLDTWFDDESASHWFRKLVFLVASVAVVYYFVRAKSRQLADHESSQPELEDELDDEAEVEGVDTVAFVDVIAAEFAVTDDEYVIDDEEEITEDTEIDLALEEAIENGDEIEDDDLEGFERMVPAKLATTEIPEAEEDEYGDADDEDDPLEGVLAETDDEDLEEQMLEPSPAPDEPPKWVAPVDGECPPGHPVKARFSTGRYHVPGDRGYDKITPDCCYENVDDAKADGFAHSRWS